MTKRKDPSIGRRLTVHTVETLLAKTEEVGDCREWTGYMGNNVPMANHEGRFLAVRRVMLMLSGVPEERIGYACCKHGNQRCVNPDHIVNRSQSQHSKLHGKRPARNEIVRLTKMQEYGRAHRAKLTIEQVRDIRSGTDSGSAAARRHGVSRQTVERIRLGVAWRDLASPFAGLGAR